MKQPTIKFSLRVKTTATSKSTCRCGPPSGGTGDPAEGRAPEPATHEHADTLDATYEGGFSLVEGAPADGPAAAGAG